MFQLRLLRSEQVHIAVREAPDPLKTAIFKALRHGICSIIAFAFLLAFPGNALSVEAEREQGRLLRGQPVVTNEKKASGRRWVKARILINARPDVVWHAVHEERKSDPDLAYSKVISQDQNRVTLEQKFAFLPVIGTATCLMVDEEVPNERIDYKLLKSDHFKAMEGSWVLTPHLDGNHTLLELSTYLEFGIPVPRALMDTVTAQKLQRRLTHVKQMSEKIPGQLAQSEKLPGTTASGGL